MICPINERTGDGNLIGQCCFYLFRGKICPRHKDVSKAVKHWQKTGELTHEKKLIKTKRK